MISSTANATVKNIAALQKKGKERRNQGLFVIEGRKLFEEVFRDAPDAIHEVYVTEAYLEQQGHKKWLEKVSYELVTDNVMKAMAETMEPQGILATVRIPKYDKKALMEKK